MNSNPATIMTDPGLADATYIEPITPEIVERIIAREKPDALLPTMGGQTALNTAMQLAATGVLEQHGVELIGARADVIERAEDRLKFRDAMAAIGIECPQSAIAHSLDEARAALGARRPARRHPPELHPRRHRRRHRLQPRGIRADRQPAASTPRPPPRC